MEKQKSNETVVTPVDEYVYTLHAEVSSLVMTDKDALSPKEKFALFLKSRRNWTAAVTTVVMYLVTRLGLPPELAELVVWGTFLLGVALVLGLSLEDAARQIASVFVPTGDDGSENL